MAVIRTSRFKTDPALAEEMIARRADLIAAVRAAYPGLTEARLARVSADTWVDMWRWDSPAAMQAAFGSAPAFPEVKAAFALATDLTAENAELVDER